MVTVSVVATVSGLLLMLSYHRRLIMISEALEMCVEDGRASHSWCMCVVCHCCGGLGGGRDGGGMHAGQSQRGWVGCMSGDAGALTECLVIH